MEERKHTFIRKSSNSCEYTRCITDGKKTKLIYAHLVPYATYDKNVRDPTSV